MFDKPIPIDCWHSIINSTNSTAVRKATAQECLFSKVVGMILLFVAIISLIAIICSLKSAKNHFRISLRDQKLTTGMFISSLFVILISTPPVLAQCFLCHRLCSPFICRLEGFNSFFNGCVTMYMLVALSIVRYATTANSSFSIHFQRQIKSRHFLLVFICSSMAGIWAIPPIFGRVSAYVPEGLGFHCGLDWFDRSLSSRIYFFLLFVCVYFIPLIIIISINISIHRTIYRLAHLYPVLSLGAYDQKSEDMLRRHISTDLCEQTLRRLQHLYEDRRFVIATGVSVVIYLIAWTPYSLIALSQLFGRNFSLREPWIVTACAVIAKLSMISNPVIYTILLKTRETPAIIRNEDHLY
ncbi:unnamed protein product [Adineta ricciae]|uniref:G-protein coupled receptors family 1 profile domain-containing protein n=1 Tax=Adineta ricciae TaxID=249248 RepID=A0A815EGN1_ADIRI|nr:unnamed protein product [Adineta ricciae]